MAEGSDSGSTIGSGEGCDGAGTDDGHASDTGAASQGTASDSAFSISHMSQWSDDWNDVMSVELAREFYLAKPSESGGDVEAEAGTDPYPTNQRLSMCATALKALASGEDGEGVSGNDRARDYTLSIAGKLNLPSPALQVMSSMKASRKEGAEVPRFALRLERPANAVDDLSSRNHAKWEPVEVSELLEEHEWTISLVMRHDIHSPEEADGDEIVAELKFVPNANVNVNTTATQSAAAQGPKRCMLCSEDVAKEGYSKKQFKRTSGTGKCKRCLESKSASNPPVSASNPPVFLHASATMSPTVHLIYIAIRLLFDCGSSHMLVFHLLFRAAQTG